VAQQADFVPAHPHSDEFEERAKLFSAKVRNRVDELGMTQLDLVAGTGLSQGYLKLLLNGRGSHKDPKTGTYRAPNPTLDVIWKLADALDLEISYLADFNQPLRRATSR